MTTSDERFFPDRRDPNRCRVQAASLRTVGWDVYFYRMLALRERIHGIAGLRMRSTRNPQFAQLMRGPSPQRQHDHEGGENQIPCEKSATGTCLRIHCRRTASHGASRHVLR